MKRILSALFCILWILAAAAAPVVWRNTLAPASTGQKISLLDASGAPRFCILIAKDAKAKEQYLAQELKARLDSFGHGEFAVITDDAPQKGPELRIGKTARSEAILPDVGFDGISLRAREDGSLEIQGGEHCGLANAVYTFLEEDLGYRYWAPGAEHFPEELAFIPVTRSYTPPLEWREPFIDASFHGEFALRNRTDSPDEFSPAEAGGRLANFGYIHTLVWLVPPEKHFKEHPDWFMMDESGKRVDNCQWCETNPELAQYLVDYYEAWIQKSGVPKYIGITKRDGGGVCHCPECAKVNQAEESDAGSLLVLVNRVAKELGKKYPDIRFVTFAYLETEKLPKNMKTEPNVSILYCNTKNAWKSILTFARDNEQVRADVQAWGKVAPLVIWDYSTNFEHYFLPLPNLEVIADNIRFWVENHAVGIMTQGAYQCPGSEREYLRAWVIAHLLWNPSLDWRELRNEFIAGYFGKAAAPMLKYNEMLEAARFDKDGKPLEIGVRYGASAPFLTDEFLSRAKALFAEAHQLAGDDAALQSRIDRDELSILYAELLKQIEAGVANPDFEAVRERFCAGAEKIGVVVVGERPTGLLSDFKTKKVVSKSTAETLFRNDDAVTVIRLNAIWRVRMISDSPTVIEDGTELMAENADEKGFQECNVNEAAGWNDQGLSSTVGTGVYRQHLRIDPPAARKYWYLVFPGIDEEGWICLNGKPIGEKSVAKTGLTPQDLWNYPLVLDVSKTLRLGFAENAIAVKVFNVKGIGGICGGVYLIGSNEPLTSHQAVELLPEKSPWGWSDAFEKEN